MMNKLTLAVALMAVVAALLSPTALAATKPAEKPLPKLLDLGADKCIPCKKMAGVLEELKKENAGRLDVEFIDVWKTDGAAKKFKIKLIPTQIFYGANGKELFRHEGFFGKEDILAKWKELGVNLGGKPSAAPATPGTNNTAKAK
jgi:thioredoxin 1